MAQGLISRRRNNKERYIRCKTHGICIQCRKNKALTNRTECRMCTKKRSKQKKLSKQRYENTN